MRKMPYTIKCTSIHTSTATQPRASMNTTHAPTHIPHTQNRLTRIYTHAMHMYT